MSRPLDALLLFAADLLHHSFLLEWHQTALVDKPSSMQLEGVIYAMLTMTKASDLVWLTSSSDHAISGGHVF